MTVKLLALIIVAVLLAQVCVVALLGFYRRKRQYLEIDKRAGDPRAVSESRETAPFSVDEAHVTAANWQGFREFRVKGRELEDANGSTCSFYLVPTDGQPLPGYRPGRFLTFRLEIEDPITRRPRTLVRCYSLSDRSRPDYYRISVKRVPAPADEPKAPPGLSSNFFHDHVATGSTLMVKAPSGRFHLVEDEALPIVLLGGGIGITPMLSILHTLLESGTGREIWLFYGVRNGAEQIMTQQLHELAGVHGNFHLHICHSSPREEDIAGVDYRHRGRVDIALLRATLKLTRHQFYVCGPKSMMESLVPGLEAWGVDSGDIYYESFGPATLVKHEKPKSGQEGVAAGQITVTFAKTGTSLPWDPDAESLLQFAEAQGIAVESGCRAGSCGSCRTSLQAGEVEYSQQPDADMEAGQCLLCISTPKGDLTLAA